MTYFSLVRQVYDQGFKEDLAVIPSSSSSPLVLFLLYTMLPWSNKAGSSSSASTSIRRDENIANTHQYRPTGEAESARFRSSLATQDQSDSTGFDTFIQSSSSSPSASSSSFQPIREPSIIHHPPPAPPVATDGAEVLGFLSSAEYTDAIHGDDLAQESQTYQSHRHQADHEHSVAEHRRRHQWTELLAAEDIVAYLQELKYTDDIYGAPPAIESLIKEAQQEVMDQPQTPAAAASNHTAVSRLAMVRDHLLGHAHGQVEAAAKHAHQMKQDDWDQIFSKGGSL